jgi:predicted DNA-binding protein
MPAYYHSRSRLGGQASYGHNPSLVVLQAECELNLYLPGGEGDITIMAAWYYHEGLMKTISLKLQEDLDARLTAVARRRGEPRSALVREALETYLDATGDPAAGSCLELVADLVGCVKGPRDLSCNAEHLHGYGR